MELPGATALVTGGNRGIGLEVARELGRLGATVVLGARDADRGERAAADLRREDIDARSLTLDVGDPGSVEQAGSWLAEHGRLDVLVNNAGIYPGGSASAIDFAVAEEAWRVNALGPWRMAVAVLPLLRARPAARVVNVSSEAGSLASMSAAMPAYNVSKAAVNAVTRVLAADLAGTGVLVNAVCPGWVATEMGGAGAPRSVAQGAASVMWAVTIPDDGPTGGFFRDGQSLPW